MSETEVEADRSQFDGEGSGTFVRSLERRGREMARAGKTDERSNLTFGRRSTVRTRHLSNSRTLKPFTITHGDAFTIGGKNPESNSLTPSFFFQWIVLFEDYEM